MRCLALLTAVFLSGALNAQLSLTGNANGLWMIYRSDQHIVLPSTVHYLGNFDEAGLAIFAEYDRFGVLDQEGKIRCAAKYHELKALGNGIYSGMRENGTIWMDLKVDNPEEKAFEKADKLTKNWYLLTRENQKIWLNVRSGREFALQKGDSLLKAGFGFLYVQTAQGYTMYSPQGDSIPMANKQPIFSTHYLLLDAPSYKAVIFNDRIVEIPGSADNLELLENEIAYTLGGIVTVLDGETGAVAIQVNCDALKSFDRDHYLCKKGMNWGLVRKDGSTFISPIYLSVTKTGEYYQVMSREGNGLLDSLGNQVLPCKYRWITLCGEFFKLTSSLDLSGLVSRKNPALNLPCQYNDIRLSRNVIKAYTDDYLRIIHINSTHDILDNVLLENVIEVQMRGKREADEYIDSRLFDLGWFFENIGQFDDEGFLIGERLKWGLMGAEDSLLLTPRFKQPVYVPQADFSLIYRGNRKFSFYGNPEEDVKIWSLISHISGKALSDEFVISADTSDYLFRNYMRLFTLKGPAVLLPDNKLMHCAYIDPGNSDLQRYCVSASHTVSLAKQSDKESVGLPSWDQNDNPNFSIAIKEYNKTSNFVKFPDARWNFLDPEGKQLFAEDFEYVHPFYRGTAIVKQNGSWGLMNEDTVLIPARYSSIGRLSELGDTVFLVRQTPKGIQLYDASFRALDTGVTRLLGSGENLTLVECDRSKKVMNHTHQYISDSSNNQKIISEHFVLSKLHKEYVLRDASGNLLGSFELKPEAVLFEQYVLVQSHGKFGLLDFFGDTLLDFQFSDIRQSGSFLIGNDQLKNPIYNKELVLLFNAKDARVLVDREKDHIALVKNEKCKVYAADGTAVGKVNAIDAQLFHNGWLMTVGVEAKAKNLAGELVDFPEITRNIEGMDGYGFLVEDLKGRFYYYDPEFTLRSDSLNLRHARYLGSGCISANCDRQTLLMTAEHKAWLPGGTRAVGRFESGRLLMKLGDDQHYFLDEQLENPFRRVFSKAHPFIGPYASVEEGDGWTIIDQSGARKSLGSYEELLPIGNGLFSSTRQPLFGLFDSKGNTILPVEFQEIQVINSNLIKAVREGHIEYYDRQGNEVFPALLTRELTSR